MKTGLFSRQTRRYCRARRGGYGKIFARLAKVEEQHRLLPQGEYDYLTSIGAYFGLPDFHLEAMVH